MQGAVAPAKAYDINVILPLTGGGAFLGKEEQTSLQVAEAVINKAGGVHGQNVHFVLHDDQTNPQTAVQLTNQVIASKPAVLLGSTHRCELQRHGAADAERPGHVLLLARHSSGRKGSYVFSSNVSTEDLASAQIRYFRLMGWTRMAIMTSADATGQDAERVLDEVLARPENKDVTIVDRAHFNITDVSVAAQIEHIKEAKPQALIAWSTGSPIGHRLQRNRPGRPRYSDRHDRRQYDLCANEGLCRLLAEAALHAGRRVGAAPGNHQARSRGGNGAEAVFRCVRSRQDQA